MHDTGFELHDMLLTCKFAEGDSRILQQKLTRDRLKRVQKAGVYEKRKKDENERREKTREKIGKWTGAREIARTRKSERERERARESERECERAREIENEREKRVCV
jgi:hypothetical protein